MGSGDPVMDKRQRDERLDQTVEIIEHPSLRRRCYRKKSAGRDFVRSFCFLLEEKERSLYLCVSIGGCPCINDGRFLELATDDSV